MIWAQAVVQAPYDARCAGAQPTSRVRLGAACWNPYTMHPYEIAGQLAALQQASSGRAYLGLVTAPEPLSPAWADKTGRRTALRVADVVGGSPADVAGLRRGDSVLAVNGTPLADAQSLQRLLLGDAIGARIEITVLRNGALVDVVAEPTELEDQ